MEKTSVTPRQRSKALSIWKVRDIINLVLGVVFLAASIPKIVYPYEFLSNVYAYGLLSRDNGIYVSVMLPWLEFLVGASLVTGILANGALILASFLCAFFVFVQVWAFAYGLEIACGCFLGQEMISYVSIGRTVLLLAAAVASLAALCMPLGVETGMRKGRNGPGDF